MIRCPRVVVRDASAPRPMGVQKVARALEDAITGGASVPGSGTHGPGSWENFAKLHIVGGVPAGGADAARGRNAKVARGRVAPDRAFPRIHLHVLTFEPRLHRVRAGSQCTRGRRLFVFALLQQSSSLFPLALLLVVLEEGRQGVHSQRLRRDIVVVVAIAAGECIIVDLAQHVIVIDLGAHILPRYALVVGLVLDSSRTFFGIRGCLGGAGGVGNRGRCLLCLAVNSLVARATQFNVDALESDVAASLLLARKRGAPKTKRAWRTFQVRAVHALGRHDRVVTHATDADEVVGARVALAVKICASLPRLVRCVGEQGTAAGAAVSAVAVAERAPSLVSRGGVPVVHELVESGRFLGPRTVHGRECRVLDLPLVVNLGPPGQNLASVCAVVGLLRLHGGEGSAHLLELEARQGKLARPRHPPSGRIESGHRAALGVLELGGLLFFCKLIDVFLV